jgi:hypothetical protein
VSHGEMFVSHRRLVLQLAHQKNHGAKTKASWVSTRRRGLFCRRWEKLYEGCDADLAETRTERMEEMEEWRWFICTVYAFKVLMFFIF